jgi:hypothetical protein
MTNIVAFSGKKQSGKTTAVNFIHGYEMKRHNFIKKFDISETGNLIVNALYRDENDKEFESMGVFDLTQDNDTFINYASSTFWPFVKAYNFADPLKRVCMSLFGLTKKQCYGTEEQKNSLTPMSWEDMPGVVTPENYDSLTRQYNESTSDFQEYWGVILHAAGPMTAREVMQFYGTNICRKMYDRVWIDTTMRQIKEEAPELALIGDCRFENEIDEVHDNGGKVIYFTRNSESEDSHDSEKASEFIDKYDCVLDNASLSIDEQNAAVLGQIQDWGILPKYSEVV